MKDFNNFKAIGQIGFELADLHRLKQECLNLPGTKYFGEGENRIETIKYDYGKLYIDSTNYFEPISETAYLFTVGGY